MSGDDSTKTDEELEMKQFLLEMEKTLSAANKTST